MSVQIGRGALALALLSALAVASAFASVEPAAASVLPRISASAGHASTPAEASNRID